MEIFWAILACLLSAGLAGGAVVLPQFVAFWAARRAEFSRKLFQLWGLKFSLTLLFLAGGASGLAGSGLMAAPFFVGGAVFGVLVNVFWAARLVPVPAKEKK